MSSNNSSQISTCPDAIVDLLISNNSSSKHSFYVYTASLKSASPVWRKLLDQNSGFSAPPTRDGYAVLTIEDVSVTAATIFFKVLHGRGKEVPKVIGFEDLLGISVLTDQYDCHGVIHIWAERWIKALPDKLSAKKGESEGMEILLFIANVFPEVDVCVTLAQDLLQPLLINTTNFDSETNTLVVQDSDGQVNGITKRNVRVVSTQWIPDRFLNFILETREKAIVSILDVTGKFTNLLLERSKTSVRDGLSERECRHPLCLDLAIGSFIRSLYEMNLHYLIYQPTPTKAPSGLSLSMLRQSVAGLQIATLYLVGARQHHTKIDPFQATHSGVFTSELIRRSHKNLPAGAPGN